MRILSRLLLICILLGGLAFGSYAFGKYVLSSHLFGKQGSKIRPAVASAPNTVDEPVSHSSAIRGEPRVDVEVLPADQAGDAPEPPENLSTRRRSDSDSRDVSQNPTPDSTTSGDAGENGSNADSNDNSDEANSDNRREERPRRRRKRKRTQEVSTRETADQKPSPAADDTPSRSSSNDENVPARRLDADSAAPVPTSEEPIVAQPRNDNPADLAPQVSVTSDKPEPHRTRRRRERVRRETSVSAPASRSDAPSRAPARRVEESPIPRPEGDGGGGESPVPLPE